MKLKEMSFEIALSKVRNWRAKYSSAVYPQKVVLNLFYQIMPTEILWEDINNTFNQGGIFFNFDDAFNHISDKHRNIQLSILPNLEAELSRKPDVGDINYNSYSSQASKAAIGDNKMVEELEYCYIWFSIRDTLMLAFLACGLSGLTISNAYDKICSVWLENASFSSYTSAAKSFSSDVSFFMQINYKPNFK